MMSSTRRLVPSLLASICLVALATPARAEATAAAPSPFRIEVFGTGGTAIGNCVLIHQRQNGPLDSDLYFLTAGKLLRAAGEPYRIRIVLGATSIVETSIDHVQFPDEGEGSPDVALIVVSTALDPPAVMPIATTPPDALDVFAVHGNRGDTWIGRVAFRSASRVVSDRNIASAGELLGAPVLVEDGMFGIVTEHSLTDVPIITLVTACRDFLFRAIPDWQPAASAIPLFNVQHRVIETPLVNTECTEAEPLDVEVPIALNPGELIVDATAIATRPAGLHLGDVTVRRAGDRIVTLRFTMPAPTVFSSFACERDHALITIGIDIVSSVSR